MKTISVAISLFLTILTISIFPFSYPGNPVSAQSGSSIVLYDNDARNFSNPPDVFAYANTEHTTAPSEFVITAGGSIWRYNQWITVSDADGWIEARTTVATTSVGVQFWGDGNDGWATVYIDGVEIWTGDTRGSDNQYPGGAFVKYLQVSGLANSTHTIRVESALGQDVTILFFGLGEVADSGVVTGDRMVAYYPFDGDYQDHSGNSNHGTPKGNMTFSSGKFGQGASFDGASLIEVNDSNSLDLYDGFTFSVWLYKEDAGAGGWSVVMSKGETSALDNNASYNLAHTQNGKYLLIRLAQGNTHHDLHSTAEVSFQSWQLVTVTWDGTTIKFFVDGVLKDSMSWNVPLTNSGAKLLIGNDPPGFNEYFRGIMDDLRIYNYAINQSKISDLRTTTPTSAPSSTHTPSQGMCDIVGTWQWINGDTVHIHDDGTMESVRGISGTWRSIGNSVYELEWSNGFTDTLTISSDCQSLSGHNQYGGSVSATRISDGDTGPSEPGTSISEPTSTATSPPTSTSSGDVPVAGLVAYYPFDGDYQDYSGNGNHGNPKENMSFTTGSIGQGARFDGSSFIEVNDSNSLDLYDGFTFSVRLYKEDAGTGGYAVIFAKGDTSALNDSAPYGLAHTIDGMHPLVRMIKNNAYRTFSPTAQTDFGKWHHLVVTWDGTTIKYYIDGVDRGSHTWEGPLPSATSNLLIGSDPPGDTEYFRGIMDDFRIYNHALSPNEIGALSTATTTQTIPPTGTSPSQPTDGATTAPSIPTPAPAGVPTLTFESRSKAQGSSVQIPLTLSGVQEPIGNMDLTLSYDTSVLQATEAIKGSLTGNSIFDYNILDGKILISMAHNQGFSGDGSVAYIRFNVIGAEGSWSRLGIDDLSANRSSDLASMNIETINGVFAVLSIEETIADCDGDGKISVVDALCALQMAVGKKAEDLSMDINNDGKVTSLDARQILALAVASGAIDTAYEGELAELVAELEACENCVGSGIEVLDTNSDGTDDKWRYSLIESEVEEGLFAQEIFELEQTTAGMQGTIIVTLENRGDIDYLDYEYLVEIPKSFAETVDELELPDSFEVTDPDPAGKGKADCPKGSKVSWNFKKNDWVHNYDQFIKDGVLSQAKQQGNYKDRVKYVLQMALKHEKPDYCDLIDKGLLGDVLSDTEVQQLKTYIQTQAKPRIKKFIDEKLSGKTAAGSSGTGSTGGSGGASGGAGTGSTTTSTGTSGRNPGDYGMKCLPGDVCNEGECQDGICIHCGSWGEPCCYEQDPGGKCTDFGYDPPASCNGGYCYHESDDCGHVGYKACDRDGQKYCYDGVVDVTSSGTLTLCIACGDYKQPCCQYTDPPCDYGKCKTKDGTKDVGYPHVGGICKDTTASGTQSGTGAGSASSDTGGSCGGCGDPCCDTADPCSPTKDGLKRECVEGQCRVTEKTAQEYCDKFNYANSEVKDECTAICDNF